MISTVKEFILEFKVRQNIHHMSKPLYCRKSDNDESMYSIKVSNDGDKLRISFSCETCQLINCA